MCQAVSWCLARGERTTLSHRSVATVRTRYRSTRLLSAVTMWRPARAGRRVQSASSRPEFSTMCRPESKVSRSVTDLDSDTLKKRSGPTARTPAYRPSSNPKKEWPLSGSFPVSAPRRDLVQNWVDSGKASGGGGGEQPLTSTVAQGRRITTHQQTRSAPATAFLSTLELHTIVITHTALCIGRSEDCLRCSLHGSAPRCVAAPIPVRPQDHARSR